MGVLDFLSPKKRLKKSPEKIWDEYTSNYAKKSGLAIALGNLVKEPKNILSSSIIDKVNEIEKLILKELVELSEEEISIGSVMQKLEKIKSLVPEVGDVNYIIQNYEFLTADANELVVHMKKALETLGTRLANHLL